MLLFVSRKLFCPRGIFPTNEQSNEFSFLLTMSEQSLPKYEIALERKVLYWIVHNVLVHYQLSSVLVLTVIQSGFSAIIQEDKNALLAFGH